MGRRPVSGLLAAALVTLVGCQSDPTIRGEIDDVEIRLEQEHAPDSVWLELSNVGTEPCEFVAMWTELPPHALPVRDGRVVMSLSGARDVVTPLANYAEIDGKQVVSDGTLDETGSPIIVRPGETLRTQNRLQGHA